ncbi:MAG: hypothetical protein HQK94_14735 [Nitrospirae bacterium]|nr:hypothetical protein [Nitrospirota bacterium]MBF0536459.1 hypothetical protein [Nitrospirota bacterium]
MKKIWILSFFCFMLLMQIFLSNVYAATLYDDFSGSSVDTTKWSTATSSDTSRCAPGSCSVTESSGYLVLTSWAYLNTVSQYNPANGKITIRVSVKANNSNEDFSITTRSDKTLDSSVYVHNGIRVDIPFNGNVSINKEVNGVQTSLSSATNASLSSGSFHDVTVTDDGTNITVTIDGSLILSASDSTQFSNNYISFVGRPNEGWMNNIAYLDYVSISTGSDTISTTTTTSGVTTTTTTTTARSTTTTTTAATTTSLTTTGSAKNISYTIPYLQTNSQQVLYCMASNMTSSTQTGYVMVLGNNAAVKPAQSYESTTFTVSGKATKMITFLGQSVTAGTTSISLINNTGGTTSDSVMYGTKLTFASNDNTTTCSTMGMVCFQGTTNPKRNLLGILCYDGSSYYAH